MSLDLEHFYDNLGAQADQIALPPLESIRRRGRLHRAIMIAATVSPVVAILTAIAVVWSTLSSPPQPDAEQRFLAFNGAAPPVLRYGGGKAEDAVTVTRGNTAFARWTEAGNEAYAAAIDLGTIRPLWGPVSVGKFIGVPQMWASRGAVLLASAQRPSPDQLVALDPATGQVMWRHNFNFELDRLLLYDDVAIVNLTEMRHVAALDLRTGKSLWQTSWAQRPLGVTSMRRSDEFAELGGYGSLPTPSDRRLVLHQADGTIQVRDVGSGTLLSEQPGGPRQATTEVAIDGRLYSASPQGVTQIGLDPPGPPRKIYSWAAHRVAPCGKRLVCVLGDDDLAAIDPVSGLALWYRPAAGDIYATPAAIQVRLDRDIVFYDLTGKRLLTIDGVAHWIDEEHLFAWEKGNTVSVNSVLTGKSITLGKSAPAICSWNRTTLTCPTEHGISVWRYRASE